jgi:uncharacterized protein (DUF1330 family)
MTIEGPFLGPFLLVLGGLNMRQITYELRAPKGKHVVMSFDSEDQARTWLKQRPHDLPVQLVQKTLVIVERLVSL